MIDKERLETLSAISDPDTLFAEMERHLGEILEHKLFTVMAIDPAAGEAARLYSSSPQEYPVKGRKPLGELTDWGKQVIGEGKPYIGYSAEDIRAMFPDHELILQLGCESVLNVPIFGNDKVLGTINMLHEADWYQPDHAARVAPFAALLRPVIESWAAS